MSDARQDKRLIIHLGYHKTGSSSLQHWLLQNADALSSHLACYNLADGSSNPLKFAAQALVLGRIDAPTFRTHVEKWAELFRGIDHPVICVTDEGLPGLPLGSLTDEFRETGIYPRAPEIVGIMAEVFAEFDPIFVVFERAAEPWLKSIHNQMHKQGCVSDDYVEFLERFEPNVDWPAMRAQLTAAIETGSGGRGTLEVCSFEDEFKHKQVRDMRFISLLNIPQEVMGNCDATLPHINPSVPLRMVPPPKLQGLVLGGSNSMLQGGWVNLLRRDFGQLAEITNLSVGACTTLMGLFRFLSTANRPTEAAVFWEYGVNEFNHLKDGQSLETMLYHVEWLIQLCIRERRPLIPVIMRTRTQGSLAEDPYLPHLRKLFNSYRVPMIDVQVLLTVLARGALDLTKWYSDDAHYNIESALPLRVAEYAMVMHRQARAPVQRPERAAHFDVLDLTLLRPTETEDDVFDNSIMRVPFTPFRAQPEIAMTGRVLGAAIVTSGSGPAIEIDLGEGRISQPISTQVDYGAGAPVRQVRQLVLADSAEGPAVDGAVKIRAVEPEGTPQIQTMYCWKTPNADAPPALGGNGLAALICEVARV